MSPYQKSTEKDLLVSNNNDEKVVAVASQPALPFTKRVVAVVAAGTAVVAVLSSSSDVTHSASVSPFSQASLMRSVNVNGLSSGIEKCIVPSVTPRCQDNLSVKIDGHKECWGRCSTDGPNCPEDFFPVPDNNCFHYCPSVVGQKADAKSYLCSDQA